MHVIRAGTPIDQAVWTRVEGIQGAPLDLLAARLGKSHFAPHAHEEYAIGACTEGVEVIRYRGERVRTGPGTVVVIEPGESHTGGPAIDEGMAYRVLYPSPGLLLDGTEGSTGPPHFPDPVIADAELAERLRRAHMALTRGTDPLEGESRILSVPAELVRRHAVSVRPDPGPRDAGGERIARAVMDRLTADLASPPTLTEIAADLAMSRYQVLRSFRRATGMPPYAWLAQHRVNCSR